MWLMRLAPSLGDVSPSSSCSTEDVVLPLGRLLLRLTVTDEGILSPNAEPVRGDPRGVPGAGSFDRAECTLCSIFCILPMSPLIWCSDSDRGNLSGALLGRAILGLLGGFIVPDIAVLVLDASEGPLVCRGRPPLVPYTDGRGVGPASGIKGRLFVGTGVF